MIVRRHFLALSLLAAAGGCAGGGEAGRLSIGYQRNGILYIARSRGAIDKRLQARNVRLDWAEFPSGPPLIEAMNAGAVDFGAVGDTPVVYAQAAQAPIRLVGAQVYEGRTAGNAFLTRPQAPVASVAGLRGKRIGYTKGSSAEVAALSALADAGLSIADVVPVTLAPGDGVTALGRGSIDALFTWDPYFTIAQSRLSAVETRFDRAGLLTVTLFVARDAVLAAPVPLHAFLDELRAEAAWANAHLGEVTRLLANAARMSTTDIAAVLARLGERPFRVDPPSDAVFANQQRVADTLLAGGAIPKRLDPRQFADRRWRPA